METFPINIFPRDIQLIIVNLEKHLGFPRDFIGTAILLALSASIGKTYKIKVKTSWIESACLFICLVGRPGANKSHPLTWAIKPLLDATERNFKKALGQDVIEDDMFSTEIPAPFPERYVANNITPEAMLQIMAEANIRLLIWSDEISGFLKNMNKYNKGSDEELLLSIYSGQTIIKDLKTQAKVFIPNAFACIGGTTQPDVIKTLFKVKENNGLRDRFLFANLENAVKSKMIKEDLAPQVVVDYNLIIQTLLRLELDHEGNPNILSFSEEAENFSTGWYNENVDKINSEENDLLCGIYTKLDTYFFRFALIIQLARWACGEATNDIVDLESATAAKELVEYFRIMNTKTLRVLSTDPIDALTDLQKAVYVAIIGKDGEFNTRSGVSDAIKAGMSERGFHYFLKNKEVFKRIGLGRYKKVF
jgi:hypothetical protein